VIDQGVDEVARGAAAAVGTHVDDHRFRVGVLLQELDRLHSSCRLSNDGIRR